MDGVIARAAQAGKPLIIEFYTGWCVPCKLFDARVLPDPRVQAELAKVEFVRYDAERGSGIAAAERFRVNAFPTFLAVDDKGEVRMTSSGAAPEQPERFVEFVQRGSVVVQSEDRVLATRKRAPGDPRIAEATGRWYVEHDRPGDALAHLDAAAASDKANALGVAAEAAWFAAGIRRTLELRARITRDLLAYVRSYPGTQHAVEALTVATVGANLPAAERRKLWELVVDAHKASASALNEIVYDALAAGELDVALVAARRQVELTKGNANSHDTLAEVHHARREQAEALAHADQALALVKDGDRERPTIQANRARFAADPPDSGSGITGIRRQVAELWKRIGSIESRGPAAMNDAMTAMVASMNSYRSAKSAVLADVGKLCAAHAGALTEAYARIDLGGAEPKIAVLEPDASAPLRKCLVDKLRAASYPKRPPGTAAKSVDRVPLKDDPMPAMH
ncbi:MAG TPA: thioredoxin family protein [Kofleriaceae bacterium]|nr:thioredoxin family protein [Kofleriaceae bacterium]